MRLALGIAALLYLAGYEVIRFTNAEVWEKDYETYVIFPKSPIALYYAYRPLTYLDGALTGMRFHVGPHPGPEIEAHLFDEHYLTSQRS